MFNIGPGELIVILIVALIVFGPERLPDMAKTVGKGMRELRRYTEDMKDQVESEFYKLDDDKPKVPTVRVPPGPRLAANAPPLATPPLAGLPPAPLAVPDPLAPAPVSAALSASEPASPDSRAPGAPSGLGADPAPKKND